MKTNFKVGQTVYCALGGFRESLEGNITHIDASNSFTPIHVRLSNKGLYSFTLEGKLNVSDEYPRLSHTPYTVKLDGYSQIELKELPDLKKDDWVIVSEYNVYFYKRHFSHFDENGIIHCFKDGLSSSETELTVNWKHYELLKNK